MSIMTPAVFVVTDDIGIVLGVASGIAQLHHIIDVDSISWIPENGSIMIQDKSGEMLTISHCTINKNRLEKT